mgnify:CR=1 FL=1
MRVAIMQPYIFPYIGYFQLIHAVDTFVFYDDVDFIKRGWINRNRLLVNGEDHLFTIPCVKASQNRPINRIKVHKKGKWKRKLLATIKHNYTKALYFDQVFPIIKKILDQPPDYIGDLAIKSVEIIWEYLNMRDQKKWVKSSELSVSGELGKADRLIEITLRTGGTTYINAPGGKKLYDKSYFKDKGVSLNFIDNTFPPYQQFSSTFIPGLSIIDILMHNSIQEIQNNQISSYTLS